MTASSDVLQARYFIVELERQADDLVRQIDHLDTLVGGKAQARYRRGELFEVRRLIDSLRDRFGVNDCITIEDNLPSQIRSAG